MVSRRREHIALIQVVAKDTAEWFLLHLLHLWLSLNRSFIQVSGEFGTLPRFFAEIGVVRREIGKSTV